MTEEKARGYGLNTVISNEATINAMVEKIEGTVSEKNGIN